MKRTSFHSRSHGAHFALVRAVIAANLDWTLSGNSWQYEELSERNLLRRHRYRYLSPLYDHKLQTDSHLGSLRHCRPPAAFTSCHISFRGLFQAFVSIWYFQYSLHSTMYAYCQDVLHKEISPLIPASNSIRIPSSNFIGEAFFSTVSITQTSTWRLYLRASSAHYTSTPFDFNVFSEILYSSLCTDDSRLKR